MSTNKKVLLCRCEDVTHKDVVEALRNGYTDLEEVKRYTGFGTGPCQGKECLALIAATMIEQGLDPSQVQPFTSRPPLVPTELKHFAADDCEP
jgi:sarcosine oxidase subunit beta